MNLERATAAVCLVLFAASACSAATPRAQKYEDRDSVLELMEDFAMQLLNQTTYDVVDSRTGKKISDSKVALIQDPADPDEVKLGMFLRRNAGEQYTGAPGEMVETTICSFRYPEMCKKEVPYPGAPDTYLCGESDEAIEATGFECSTTESEVDDDGDFNLLKDMDDEEPMLCPPDGGDGADDVAEAPTASAAGKDEDDTAEEGDAEGDARRRRHLLQGRQRLRSGTSAARQRQRNHQSRSVRRGSARSFTSNT